MLKSLKNKKNILISLVVMLGCFFAYQYWGEAATSSSQLISTGNVSEVGDETLQLLSELKTLVLDEDIFTDKVFQNLEDFSMELQPQPVGRNNPFAPVGTDGEYIAVNVNISENSACEGDSCSAEIPESQ